MSEVVAALTSDELEAAMLVSELTYLPPNWRHASSEEVNRTLSRASSQQNRLSALRSWHVNRLRRGASHRKCFSPKKKQVTHIATVASVRNERRLKHVAVSALAIHEMRSDITMTVTITDDDTHLQKLIGIAGLAARTLKREKRSLGDYIGERDGRKIVLKYEGASIDPGDATDHMTSTAFFLSRLQRSASVVPDRLSSTLDFAGKATLQELSTTLESDFNHLYESIRRSNTSTTSSRELYEGMGLLGEKSAGNPQYSASLHLRGLTSALNVQANPTAFLNGCKLATVLAHDLARRGYYTAAAKDEPLDDEVSLIIEGKVNWYVTYLMVDALSSWVSVCRKDILNESPEAIQAIETASLSLKTAYEKSMIGLSRMLALHSASHDKDFDALDLSSCLSVLLKSSSADTLLDIQSTAITRRAIEILTKEFVHTDGTFSPKSPPLVDQAHTQMFVSSAEVAELLLDAGKDLLSINDLMALSTTTKLVCERSRGHRGWGQEGAGSSTRASAFDACSSTAFLMNFIDAWERLRAESVGRSLGLGLAPSINSTYPLPNAIREKITSKTIEPIKKGRRDLASMSLLLYGPPGTAKTTIAKRVAAELGWPLLALDPSKLMSSGVDGIAVEADSLFTLLPGLRDVVVLFDEFEGVFLKRANSATDMSRFLTTSMLPRLHELRDARRIVFIIATNDRNAIDPAAYRPGRIDEHIEVEAPDVHVAGEITRTIANDVVPLSGSTPKWEEFWQNLIEDKEVSTRIDGLTPAYLNKWVRTVAIQFQEEGYTVKNAIKELDLLSKRHEQELEQFRKNGKGGE